MPDRLLNHLVPCAELRDKTLWLATMIAKNRRDAVMGVKALLLEDRGAHSRRAVGERADYTTNVARGTARIYIRPAPHDPATSGPATVVSALDE